VPWLAATVVAFVLSSCAFAAPNVDQRAEKIIALTRKTQSNFVVISDVFVAIDDMEPQKFVGGEFHSGVHHRIEDPNNRVVANCSTLEGHQLWIPQSKRNHGSDIATGACGIAPTDGAESIKFLGKIVYKFGKADRVQVTIQGYKRTYDVLENGAIVRNIWQKQSAGGPVVYKSAVKTYCTNAMPSSVFTAASLDAKYLNSACEQ
jgi:hypothetical protein